MNIFSASKRLLRVAFCLLASSVVTTVTVLACSCIAPPPPLDAAEDADVVFAGKVIRIFESRGEYGDKNIVLFEVARTFKGDASSGVVVTSKPTGANCGFSFSKGESYIVYAYGDEPQTSICTRTSRIDRAQEDLEAFDALDLADAASDSPRCGGPTNAAALQSILFVCLFVFSVPAYRVRR